MTPRFPTSFPDLGYWQSMVSCQQACPVRTDSGAYVQAIARGDTREAFLIARSPNPLASICGLVCAAPCETACRRGKIDAPISIRALKRSVTEKHGSESLNPEAIRALFSGEALPGGSQTMLHLPKLGQRIKAMGQKVAVIGAGPAGLACAHDLAVYGFHVTVFEAHPAPGGMARYGIPEYRLPRNVIDSEVAVIEGLGVEFRYNTPLTPEHGVAWLREQGYDAVFLGVGVQKGRDINLPGRQLDGIVPAVDYLLNVNRGYRMDFGEHVVVIGGGLVALDVARTVIRPEDEAGPAEDHDGYAPMGLDVARMARRRGAQRVTLVSLEPLDQMPLMQSLQGREEYEQASEEGVEFLTGWGPNSFVGSGHVQSIQLRQVSRVFDENGRFAPEFTAEYMDVEASGVVLAIGQRGDTTFLTEADGVKVAGNGTVPVDRETMRTSNSRVWAGGDIAFGPRNLIDAVADGKHAARDILDQLTGVQHPQVYLTVKPFRTAEYHQVDEYELLERIAPPTQPIDRRTGINVVEMVYPDAEAATQGARCLVCHTQTIYDPELCILCNRCVDICPENCLAIVPLEQLSAQGFDLAQIVAAQGVEGIEASAMLKDDDSCIRCGLCATRCPTGAFTMEHLTWNEMIPGMVPVQIDAHEPTLT